VPNHPLFIMSQCRKLTSLLRGSLLRSSCIALSALATILSASDTIEGMKPFDNRVEGTAVELHGDEDITLLGIDGSFEHFPKNSTLQVQFYLPGMAEPSAKIFVEAREIVDTKHYLMQSKRTSWNTGSWNIFTPWPTKDVIDPLGLDPGNIAVLAGYRDGTHPTVYLPVDVTAQPSQPTERPYTFHFETAWDLHSLEKSITGPSGKTTILKTDECKISPSCVIYSAASSQAFEVDMSGLSEGIYSVHLVGHIPGNSLKPDLLIRIYHRPK
jgi:hypothetical protein